MKFYYAQSTKVLILENKELYGILNTLPYSSVSYSHKSPDHTHFDLWKKMAHPSTNLRSCSPMVRARDLGLKIPSYPSLLISGKKYE